MQTVKYFLLLFLVVALLPYLYLCFYAMPFADDFCYGWTASEKISFLDKFLKQYLYWNGRFTSDVLVNLHPLKSGSLILYQVCSFVSILATPAMFYFLIKEWITENFSAVLIAFVATLFYLCYLPNITEGVYWYIGLINYHWGCLCLLLQLTVLIRILKRGDNVLLLITSAVLLVISIGFNEVAAAVIPAFYLSALIYLKSTGFAEQNGKRKFQILCLHFAVAFIASAFVIFSPGNLTRANVFPEKFHFLHSLEFASLQTIRFISRWMLSIPFIALSLFVLGNRHKIKVYPKAPDYRLLLGLLLFTVFMAAFIPYMATGILGQHRTMNYVFPCFIAYWMFILLHLPSRFPGLQLLDKYLTQGKSLALIFLAVGCMTGSHTGIGILSDIRSGALADYKQDFFQRQAAVSENNFAQIRHLNKIPKSFAVVDTKGDTSWWVDKCMKRFYTETKLIIK